MAKPRGPTNATVTSTTTRSPAVASLRTGKADKQSSVRIRVLTDTAVAMGPGKADLLDAISSTGSISAAARAMGMSYRRAWLLVDTMNTCFRLPLVATAKGGAEGGGASLTPMGRKVLREYRALSKAVATRFHPLLRSPRPAP